jgi:hypothetical protein
VKTEIQRLSANNADSMSLLSDVSSSPGSAWRGRSVPAAFVAFVEWMRTKQDGLANPLLVVRCSLKFSSGSLGSEVKEVAVSRAAQQGSHRLQLAE